MVNCILKSLSFKKCRRTGMCVHYNKLISSKIFLHPAARTAI